MKTAALYLIALAILAYSAVAFTNGAAAMVDKHNTQTAQMIALAE